MGAQKVFRFLQRSDAASCRRLVLQDPLHDEMETVMSTYIRYILDRSPKSRQFIKVVRALTAEDLTPTPAC